MKLGRRALMKASLGMGQVALLSRLGSGRAEAQPAQGPDKLLTLFLPGGWMSLFTFCPLSAQEIDAVIPAPFVENGEPIFFDSGHMGNLDGSSAGGGPFAPLRTAKLWSASDLAAGQPDPRTGTSPNGWSWVQHKLWENTVAIHGVDQMTAAHAAGQISAMCGVASSEFKSPALQALAAHHLFDRYPDRPLPSVWIGGPSPAALALRSEAAPMHVTSFNDLAFLFSQRQARAWKDLRAADVGVSIPAVGFDGAPVPGVSLNPIEDRVARRTRALRGMTNEATDGFLELLHGNLLGVSKVLARDVTTALEKTKGVERLSKPFWAPAGGGYFSVDAKGFGADPGSTWDANFNLALRFLKADVATSVAVNCPGIGNYGFDNGHSQGHRVQFAQVRATFDVIGRLLGEMKATPGKAPGRTLLDETLVVLLSDFSRTWPRSAPTSDHWPANTVVFAGGGLQPNRMIGSYAVNTARPNAQGFDGTPVEILEATGKVMRRPRSADVVTTALAVLGVKGVRIPGGNGEILGVRAGT
jgi:hypothetical protein